jgi:hypothetical protein
MLIWRAVKKESLDAEWLPSVCVVAKSDGILSDAGFFFKDSILF